MAYQVKDWNENFETHKSRVIEHCAYANIPNKQNGMGRAYILHEPNGGAIYGIWCLIVTALSTQRRMRAGWLTDDGRASGRAWTALDMSIRFGRPVHEIEEALQVLSKPTVGWISGVDPALSGAHPALSGGTRCASAYGRDGLDENERPMAESPDQPSIDRSKNPKQENDIGERTAEGCSPSLRLAVELKIQERVGPVQKGEIDRLIELGGYEVALRAMRLAIAKGIGGFPAMTNYAAKIVSGEMAKTALGKGNGRDFELNASRIRE